MDNSLRTYEKKKKCIKCGACTAYRFRTAAGVPLCWECFNKSTTTITEESKNV
jgi:hypothetical protein